MAGHRERPEVTTRSLEWGNGEVWALFERRLCRRNRPLGEVSEGAVEAPSDDWTEVR